jgi:hypothetical protein
MDGAVEQIIIWAEAATGLSMNSAGTVDALTAGDWSLSRQRLDELRDRH